MGFSIEPLKTIDTRSAPLRRTAATLALSTSLALLAGCATEDMKKAYDDATASSADSKSRPVDIRVVATKSSMVLDQYCPRLVQPYRLTDSAMALTKLGTELAMQNAVSVLKGKLNLPADQKVDVTATTRLAAKQLNWMPMNIERMYSEWRQKEIENSILPRNKRNEKEYAYADRILKDVLAGIDEPHDYEFKLFIQKTDQANAAAYPGGFLYVDQGLLKPQLQSKAYFAIAHEIAHVLQRHETKELESMVIDAVSLSSDLLKLLQGPNLNPGTVLNFAAGTKGLFSKHFADQELQADACATRMMVKVFPQSDMVKKTLHDFTESLGKADPEPETKPPANDLERYAQSLHTMVSAPYRRHPNPLSRRRNIDQMVTQLSVTVSIGGGDGGAGAQNLKVVEGAVRKAR